MAVDYAYALVQVAHNFGAVAVAGSPAAAWLWVREQRGAPELLAWLTVSGWLVQAMSGVGFGLTTYLSRGELPEVTGLALIALYIKVACAAAGFSLSLFYLLAAPQWRGQSQCWIWPGLCALGITALSAAAFLRWFG
ncbi:MAG TPA: hypothetical protein VIM41_15160 [Gammaproteobacteria bacterium]